MGQTCTTAEQQTNRSTLRLQNESQAKHANIQSHIANYISKQKQKIKNLTLIENSQELIYQYNDMSETVDKLKVKNWQNSEQFEQFTIQDFIDDRSFIVRAKIIGETDYIWKVISTINVDNISSKGLMDFGVFYYNFAKIKQLNRINQSFIYADSCSLQFQNQKKNKGTFIIQSQQLNNDVVPLKQLGKFMKKNEIYWQDKEFVQTIHKCCQKVESMHDNNYLVFEEFLMSHGGEIYCIGGLIEENTQLSNWVSEDFYSLGVYLLETLYGRSFQGDSMIELQKMIQEEEVTCKFEHPQSISMLLNLIKHKQPSKLHISPSFLPQTMNIPHYIESYRVKTSIQPSLILAERYIQLKDYYKGKQIMFQRLSLLMYQQKDQLSQEAFRSEVFNKLMKKMNITKSRIEECLDVLQHIILLERKIALQNRIDNQLDGLVKEYINLGILLSFNSRKQENFVKSLSILQNVNEFLGEDNESWLLNMHLAECYSFAGRLDEAQSFYKTSIKFEINQANICFFIKFYATVLNWQKAISLLRSYQGLIHEDHVYDFLIAKIILSKALCISPTQKLNQDERTKTLCQSLSITRRIFDRNGMQQILLCESYELIGDVNFYLKDNQKAFESYQKGLALARSVEYSAKKHQNNYETSKYEPSYIQRNQSELSRSIPPHMVQNSFIKRSTSQRSGGNQSLMSVCSFISEKGQKQASFVYQFRFLYNFDKKAILLSSMANCRFMERKYSQAIQLYEQARNAVLSHNLDLKNSIVGNMAICSMQMGKNERGQVDKAKIQEGRSLLEHIVNVTKKQTPLKLQSDVSYIFLLNELEAQ